MFHFCRSLKWVQSVVSALLLVLFGTSFVAYGYDSEAVLNQLGGPIVIQNEFPNLFVAEEYRSLPPENIPSEEIERVKRQLTQVIQHLAPDLLTKYEGAQKSSLLNLAQQRLHSVDPNAHLILAPGIVRTILGYVYDRLHRAWRLNPKANGDTILNQLIAQPSFDASQVLGVGSDFDLYIRSEKPLEAVKQVESIFTQTLKTEAHVNAEQQWFERLSTVVGEVHDVDRQLTSAIAQGGSTIDMLAFDLTSGEFMNPSRGPDVMDWFLRGQYDYLAPIETGSEGQLNKNPIKQAIRGLRPLVEIPFLQLRHSEQLLNDLNTPLDRWDSALETSIKKQLDKLVLNARLSAGNNRFYRQPGDPIAKRLLEIGDYLRKPIRVFVPLRPLWQKPKTELPEELLLTKEEFTKKFMDQHQRIYHGTDDVSAVSSILRNGFYISSSQQGVAAYGRGLYTSEKISIADRYAMKQNISTHGTILSLRLKETPERIRIVDLKQIEKNLHLTAGRLPMDRNELMDVLVNNYHVDIIINQYPLIQNLEAVEIDANGFEMSKILINYWLKGDVDGRAIRNLVVGLAANNQGSLVSLLDSFIDDLAEKQMPRSGWAKLNPSNLFNSFKSVLRFSKSGSEIEERNQRARMLMAVFDGLLESYSIEHLETLPQWREMIRIFANIDKKLEVPAQALQNPGQLTNQEIIELSQQGVLLIDKIRKNRIHFAKNESETTAFFAKPEMFAQLTDEEREIMKPRLSFEMIIPVGDYYPFEERMKLAEKNHHWPASWKIQSHTDMRKVVGSYTDSFKSNLEQLKKLMTSQQYREVLLALLGPSQKLANLELLKTVIANEQWRKEEIIGFYQNKTLDPLSIMKIVAVFHPKLKLSPNDLNGNDQILTVRETKIFKAMHEEQWEQLTSLVWEKTTPTKDMVLEKYSFNRVYIEDDFPKKNKSGSWRNVAAMDYLQVLLLMDEPTVQSTLQSMLFDSLPLDGRMLSFLKSNESENRLMVYRALYRSYQRRMLSKSPLDFMMEDTNVQIRRNANKIYRDFDHSFSRIEIAGSRKNFCIRALNAVAH